MDELWEHELALWLGGVELFRAAVAEGALMVFPAPVGILAAEAALAGLEGAPRWAEVDLTERAEARFGEVAVLAYRVEARRAGGPVYRALCSSCWARVGGDWRLVQHQQGPA